MSLKLESKAIKAAVGKIKFRTRAFIDGRYVNAASGKTYASVNPATGKPLAQIAACEAPDVPDDGYPDGKLANLAVETLEKLKQKGQPFFLAVGYLKPHLPFVA